MKGGLSASSVNPNSTIGERTGNTTGDLMTGGTSAPSVADGLDNNVFFKKALAILLISHLTKEDCQRRQ